MDKINSLQLRTEDFDIQQRLVNKQNLTLVTASKEREETLVNYHKEIQRLAVIIPRLEAELKAANNKANQERRDNDVEASEVTHEEIESLQHHPEVVYLYVGTNGMRNSAENVICDKVMDLYKQVHGKGMKFIYSNITPRGDLLDTKGQIANILIAQQLRPCENAYISYNNNLYNRGHFEKGNYDNDGIHVNEKGASILAQNATLAICISLGEEVIQKEETSQF